MRIVFFGTPEFAVPSLLGLLGEGFHIVAVVTQPDRPRGRSRSTAIPSPVKSAALEENLPLLQPASPRGSAFRAEMAAIQPDLGIVVAYGHILPADLLAVPPMGMINVHASLLPALRGAAPIHHAILTGLSETGISIMQMDEGMDTGPVIHQLSTDIAPDETYGELGARLSELGALALIEALTMIQMGHAQASPQDPAFATHAPKVSRRDARIEWTGEAAAIDRLVRAMDPAPGAWSSFEGNTIKLFGPKVCSATTPSAGIDAGAFRLAGPPLLVTTGSGTIEFSEVQPSGRARMAAPSWIRGLRREEPIGRFE